MSQTNLEYALAYAAIGWAVLPLHSINAEGRCSCGKPVGYKKCKPGKHPRLFTGLKEASKDPEKINTWWRQWPDANIGIVTGKISGMWVLDVDVGEGKFGDDTLDKLIAEHGPLPETVSALTGGGGTHYVFAYPEDGARSSTNVFPDIDSRGDGGYIIVEPSNHVSGGVYGWDAEADPLEGGQILPAPEWLAKVVSKNRPEAAVPEQNSKIRPSSDQQSEIALIRSAMPFVSGVDDETTWYQVGMALHAFDAGEIGFGLWCEWSQQSHKFDLAHQRYRWDKFKPGGIHLGSFFERAKQKGWAPPSARSAPPLSADPAQPEQGYETSNNSTDEPPLPDEVPGDVVDDEDDDAWVEFFDRAKNTIKSHARNVELVLSNDHRWRKVLGFCQLSNRVVKLDTPPMDNTEIGEWSDYDYSALKIWMSYKFGFMPDNGAMLDGSIVSAKKNSFHPVRRYLEGIEWDGVPRLETWLKSAFDSTDNDEYLKIIGPRCLVGAVARVMQPGCKFDNVMILEGEQGKGKSSIISVLFGDWFTDAPLPIGDKEAQQLIQGIWGYEIAELDAFNKAEETALKAFFSIQIDRFRPSYGRVAAPFPRQTVFWGTTNQDAYLKDYTGNRRYWPVYCVNVNKKWVQKHRDQLWAEALSLYKDGLQWWVDQDNPERSAEWEVVTNTQNMRLRGDVWEESVRRYLDSVTADHIDLGDVATGALKMDIGAVGTVQQNRIIAILKSMGWKSTRVDLPREPGQPRKQKRAWVRVDIEKQMLKVPL